MILTAEESMARVEVFEDSAELAARLRQMAADLAAVESYYANESADHIEGLFELVRSLAHHLKAARRVA